MTIERRIIPDFNKNPPDIALLDPLFREGTPKDNVGRTALQNYLDVPMRILEGSASSTSLSRLHKELTHTYMPIISFVTGLMERIQYHDSEAVKTLTNFSNWYYSSCNHKYREIAKPVSMQTVAHIAALKSTDPDAQTSFHCLAEFPTLIRSYLEMISAAKKSDYSEGVEVPKTHELMSRQYAQSRGVLGNKLNRQRSIPESFEHKPILTDTVIELADAVAEATKNTGTSFTVLGVANNHTIQQLSHMLGFYMVKTIQKGMGEQKRRDPNLVVEDIECLPLGEFTFAIHRYQGEENRQLSLTLAPQAIREALEKMTEPITSKGIGTCIRICFGDLPANHEQTTQSLRHGIVSATRALHTRGHRDDFGGARNSALKRIGVDSLTFRQRGQEFDIEIAYHGNMLPLHVDADGTVRFPPDIHDPEARAKIELIALSHLGEILDIHRIPREEPSTARGGGQPKPYRGKHLQIQPEGKKTRQLAKPGTNASVQDWLELPTADMTWINLAFSLAQEATHLANKPSDLFLPYLKEQGVPLVVAAKVSDLMQRLKDRKMWPPIEGEPLVIRQVSFVDEMKNIPGTGPIDTNTSRAAKQYREILPPTPKVPVAGTVFSVE